MKKVLLFFVVLLNCSFAQNGWIEQMSGTANTLWSVSFINKLTGWCVGSIPGNGTILKTTNGGINWELQTTNIANDFFACHFINDNTGWVCGSRGIILKTSNGGINWTMQPSITREDLWTIFFLNNETGWAGGTGGKILKTTNSGDNWNQYKTKSNLISILYFIDNKTGWAAADNYPKSGIILKTENGGLNWNVQLAESLPVIESVCFINAYTGWVVGNSGLILKTTNSGIKWNMQDSETKHILTDVYFLNELTGWICGGTIENGVSTGLILKTTNGGNNWIKQLDGVNFNKIDFVSEYIGFVVGDVGSIYKFTETEILNTVDQLTDIDGNHYTTLKIGNQEWITENLNVSTFRNGNSIKEARSFNEWYKARINQIPAWCHYNFDSKYKKYGKLYNIHAINDPRGLAPEGWHLPVMEEWLQLINNLGGENEAGINMKNEFGFNALFGGALIGSTGEEDMDGEGFYGIRTATSWWCLPEGMIVVSRDEKKIYYDGGACLDYSSDGRACRCIRD